MNDARPSTGSWVPLPASAESGLIRQLLAHRLQRQDLKSILEDLSEDDRDRFTQALADTLGKTTAILEVARRISDTLSLDLLLQRLVESITEFLEAERCTIFVHDPEADELYSRVTDGDTVQEIRIPRDAGLAGAVFNSNEPLRLADAYEDPRFNREIDRTTGYRTRSVLCVPIRSERRAQPIGCIQVLNKRAGEFGDEDQRLVKAIAALASSSLLNSRLHEELERARTEESQLLEVTTAISQELELEPLLDKIMVTVTQILNADRSTLFLHDPSQSELWAHLAQGVEGGSTIRIPEDAGIAGAAFSRGETINIPDAYQDDRFNPAVDRKTGYRTRSILAMPVRNKRNVSIGVIQVLNKRGGPFVGVDERRLQAFCAQASIAIENAKLFEDLRQVTRYNESILQSMSNGVITLDADSTVVKVNQAAARLLRDRVGPLTDRAAADVFRGSDAWVLESIAKVAESGEPDAALDARLTLGGAEDDALSVNMSVVPLSDTEDRSIGCMLLIEDITNEQRLRGTMARYMTKEVADKLLEGGQDALGGRLQEATVLFTDIRSFTSISERIGAQQTVALLNEYFGIMVDLILENGGILDKYIGDAMMAVFGPPFERPDDADRAVRAAVDMLRALHAFNAEREARGHEPVHMGVGLNTDEVVSGNIGSLRRMDYTVIGDGVNLASRLEGANKQYGTEVLLSASTVAKLQTPFLLREVDRIVVKGKTQPVAVYEVLDHHTDATFPHRDDVLAHYQRGLDLYRQRAWDDASAAFADALRLHPADSLPKLYQDRCAIYRETPPPADWQGVFTLTSK